MQRNSDGGCRKAALFLFGGGRGRAFGVYWVEREPQNMGDIGSGGTIL